MPHAELNAVGPCLEYRGSVAYYAGILAAKLGDVARAAHWFRRAQATDAKLRMPIQLARARAALESCKTA